MYAQEEQQQWNFPGGLKLDGHKTHSDKHGIKKMPVMQEYVIPLQQHIGEPANVQVQVGDQVLKGQMLGSATDRISAAVHAPTSGTVIAIEKRPVPHPGNLLSECIVLQSDGHDTAIPPQTNTQTTDPEQIRNCLRQAGIVGLGGAVFPTETKLAATPETLQTLIINGAECEPYISCDDALMCQYANDIIAGTNILLQACQAQQAIITIETDKPTAITAMQQAIEESGVGSLSVVTVPARYPQGGERQLIQTLTGKEVPHNGLPLDIGIVCQNVGTALAAWRAIEHGEPLLSRIVTVTGDGVKQPCNLEVPLGTLISDVIAFCGGYTDQAQRLIMGGTMMGFALEHDNLPVVKATNCILVAGNEDVDAPTLSTTGSMPCIRCGECMEVCPATLLPQQLYWHTQAQEFDHVREHNLFDCIECGCCDLVCPSHIPLTGWFRYAKAQIREDETRQVKAQTAKQRFDARTQRLSKEQAAREEKRRKKRAELKAKDPKAEIAAALERARKKKK